MSDKISEVIIEGAINKEKGLIWVSLHSGGFRVSFAASPGMLTDFIDQLDAILREARAQLKEDGE